MMRSRAFLLSVLAHLLVLGLAGGVFWRVSSRERDLLNAPIGDVFVQEGRLGGSGSKAAAPAAAKPAAPAPDREKIASAQEEGEEGDGGRPGLPDGEAVSLGRIAPDYPPVSRQLGEQGAAVFLLGIAEDGTVTSAVLEKSSGHDRLDQAAREALVLARFQPAVQDGAPIPSMKRFTVEFRLQRPSKASAR